MTTPLAPDTIAQAEALIAAHPLTHIGAWFIKACACGWYSTNLSHAAHVVQVLAAAGLLASLAHLDEPRPVDAPAPRPARRTTPFAAPRGPRRFADESRGGDAA